MPLKESSCGQLSVLFFLKVRNGIEGNYSKWNESSVRCKKIVLNPLRDEIEMSMQAFGLAGVLIGKDKGTGVLMRAIY